MQKFHIILQPLVFALLISNSGTATTIRIWHFLPPLQFPKPLVLTTIIFNSPSSLFYLLIPLLISFRDERCNPHYVSYLHDDFTWFIGRSWIFTLLLMVLLVMANMMIHKYELILSLSLSQHFSFFFFLIIR